MASRRRHADQPTAAGVRVRAIRETLDALRRASGDTLALDDILCSFMDDVVRLLKIPRLALELMRYEHLSEECQAISFEHIDELASWMAERGVTREDIVDWRG